MTFRDAGTFGFDVSTWQDVATTPQVIDFQKMRRYGASFVIVRVGQGNYIDQDFRVSWANARGNLPRAAYWYYDPRYDPNYQAMLLTGALTGDPPEGRVWLDLEFTWAGNYSSPNHWKTWMEKVKNAGYRVGVYSAWGWWEERAVKGGADLAYFGAHPGWAAQYNDVLDLIPRGWPEPLIWQKGTPAIGRAAGVESEEIDLNAWNANKNFVAEWGEIPPAPGGTMPRYEAQSNSGSSRALRPDHNTMNSAFEYVTAGSKMHGDELWTATQEMRNSAGQVIQISGDQWLRVLDVDGNTTRTGWVAIRHMGQVICTLVEINAPTDPPPTEESTVTIDVILHDVKVIGDRWAARGIKAIKES